MTVVLAVLAIFGVLALLAAQARAGQRRLDQYRANRLREALTDLYEVTITVDLSGMVAALERVSDTLRAFGQTSDQALEDASRAGPILRGDS